jgi:RNA polymerase sigma-70 factor (ECF subfamily)
VVVHRGGEPSTDGEIIAASRLDPSCFETVFKRHFVAIHRYLAARVGGPTADDLASEVFLLAFRSRLAFDLKYDDAGPWLYGIATNVVRRHHRTERRRLLAYGRIQTDMEEADATERLVERLDSSGALSEVAGALAGVEPAYRDVVMLIAGAELSYGEAARALGVPIGTIRSRMFRGRAQLRAQLDLGATSQQRRGNEAG